MVAAQGFVVDLKSADEDRLLLGKLGAELASLASLKINIPEGFVITTDAYFEFLKENNLQQKIKHLLVHFNEKDKTVSKHIKNNILKAGMPHDVLRGTFSYYRSLGWKDGKVSLTPSLTDTHLSLKGQTNIKGEAVLIQDVKKIWASYFEHDLLLHRIQRNINHFRTGIAILIQKELDGEKSGYIQNGKIIAAEGPTLSEKEEEEILEIEKKIVSQHFFPKKTNWMMSKGKIYITKLSPANVGVEPLIEEPLPTTDVPKGRIVTGVIKVVSGPKDMETIRNDEILILNALKSYEDIKFLRHAKALVLSSDISNNHIKSVLDRIGFPVIVDRSVRSKLRSGMVATVDGTRGQVYQGEFRLD